MQIMSFILLFKNEKHSFIEQVLIEAGMLILALLLCYLIVLFKRYVIFGKYYKANRAKAETVCEWAYSDVE